MIGHRPERDTSLLCVLARNLVPMDGHTLVLERGEHRWEQPLGGTLMHKQGLAAL